MSANLDLVRSLYAEWERGDWSHADWAHPEIEWVIADGPTAGRWTGVAGMAAASRELLSTVEGGRFEAEECQELDAQRVLVLVRNHGRGRTSGVEFVQKSAANLFQLRHGKVTRLLVYLDRDRALADLGLEA